MLMNKEAEIIMLKLQVQSMNSTIWALEQVASNLETTYAENERLKEEIADKDRFIEEMKRRYV